MSMGIIGTALAGAAVGAGESGFEMQKQAGRESLQQQAQEALTNREAMMENLRNSNQNTRMDRTETIRRDGEKYDLENIEPGKAKIRVQTAKDEAQAQIDIKTDPANVQKAIDAMNAMAPAEAKVKRDAMIEELKAKGTPETLKAARDIARATHIESAASVASAANSNFELGEKKRVSKLREEYLSSDATPERKEQIVKEINVLTGKKEDMIKMRVKVGEDAEGKAIMEDVLVDPKTNKRVDINAGAGKGSPYPEGTELRGKDGKAYVVRDGQPVLKDSPKPAPKSRLAASSSAVAPTMNDQPDIQGGSDLDDARNRVVAARANLQKFGLALRNAKRSEYEAAQQELASAQADFTKAKSLYSASVGEAGGAAH